MIDIDEAGIKLIHGNRKHGKAALNERVREEAPYGHDKKAALLIAIAGRAGDNGRFL